MRVAVSSSSVVTPHLRYAAASSSVSVSSAFAEEDNVPVSPVYIGGVNVERSAEVQHKVGVNRDVLVQELCERALGHAHLGGEVRLGQL